MPPIDFMFGPRFRGGQVIQQNITIKQPGGFLGFMSGLFGGLTGYMPGMYPTMPYYSPYSFGSIFPTGCYSREQLQLQYYTQQMMLRQQPYMMMPQAQMSPYAYLNQQPQQQLLDGDKANNSSTEMKNLETFFKGKDYIICQEADGKYTVADKDGKFLASGTYAEVRDKLFEVAKAEASEEVDESSDADSVDGDDSEADLREEIEETESEEGGTRSQGVAAGWYKATADKSRAIKNIDVNTVLSASKKEGQSPARFIVGHNILTSKYYGALTKNQIDTLTYALIINNRDCFNDDGTFKEGFSVEKLAIPDSRWIAANVIGNEKMTPAAAQKYAKTHVTKNGNVLYDANLMSQMNYRETYAKGVYYNDKTKTHVYRFAQFKTFVEMPEVKAIDAKGNWIDKSGKHHTKAELDRLAEERLEKRATSQGADSGSSVSDGSGRVDQTNLFEDDEE